MTPARDLMLLTPPRLPSLTTLERFARSKPRLYRWQVAALAAVGYGYVLLMGLAFALAGSGIFLTLFYGVWVRHATIPTDSQAFIATVSVFSIVIVTFWVVAVLLLTRTFWMTLPAPGGLRLRRAQVPQLFALLHNSGEAVGVGRLRRVTVTGAFEIYIHRQPRLGGLLPPSDTLVIGLPVMQALSVYQLRVLLLRELASLACQRRQVGSTWVNWQGQVWQQLEPLSFLFDGMLHWYRPLLSRHMQVMMRREEYDADAIAARITTPTILGHVLLLDQMLKRYRHICYQKLLRQAERQPHPPKDGLSHWLDDTVTAPPTEVQERWWHELLSTDDSHSYLPSLPSRLTQLGADNLFLQPFQFGNVTERAADQLLGPCHGQLAQELNRLWHMGIAEDWAKRYDYVQMVQRIEGKILEAPLTAEEVWQLAKWHLNEDDFQHGRQLLEQCLRLAPNHGPANFTLGKLLLLEGSTQGIQYLEQAMTLDAQWTEPACKLLQRFCNEREDPDQATDYVARLKQHRQQLEKAKRERSRLHGKPFCPCPLPVKDRQQIRQQLTRFPNIERAYLVQKQVEVFPQQPCHMLVVVRQTRWYTLDSGSDAHLQTQLRTALELPVGTVVFVVPQQSVKPIAKVEKALLYSRSGSPHN